jgi:uncharacterized membrane protein
LSAEAVRIGRRLTPFSQPSAAVRAASGALWGVAAAGLFLPQVSGARLVETLAILPIAGAALALADVFPADGLRRPLLALTAAVCGLAMARIPEPTFFLLVPLLAAGMFWPLGTPPAAEKVPPRFVLPVLFAMGGAVFFLQAARRHWAFGSGGMDLGLFYQTQWLVAHGLPAHNTVLGMHALGDHMLFLEFLLARLLHWYDGPETLLLVQALAVASGVFPLYWLGCRYLERPRGALVLPVLWLLSPDVHSGLLFDYNPTTIGAAALLWVAWALACRGPVAALVAVLGACAIKENLCLYVATLAVALATRLISWRRAAAVALLSLAIFTVEMAVLFPWFREGGFRHWEYEDLGSTPREMLVAAAAQPIHAAGRLVNAEQKRRSILQPLAASGYLGMAEPITLALQLPNWAERMLSSRRTRWWGYYYGMPAAATALVGLLLGWRALAIAGRAGPRLPAYAVTCALLTGFVPPYRTHDGDRRSIMYTLHRPNESSPPDVASQRAAVAFVGRDPRLKVAAQHHLIPHLAGRPFVVQLDRAEEADVIVLALNGGTWPQGRPAWRRHLRDIWGTGRFHVAFCRDDALVLRRGGSESIPCPSWERLMSSTKQ